MTPKPRQTATAVASHDLFILFQITIMQTIPLQGPDDEWPRTSDGFLVRPGSEIRFYNAVGVIRKIYDGGEYGHCAEVENADGSQGWVALRDSWMNDQREAPNQ